MEPPDQVGQSHHRKSQTLSATQNQAIIQAAKAEERRRSAGSISTAARSLSMEDAMSDYSESDGPSSSKKSGGIWKMAKSTMKKVYNDKMIHDQTEKELRQTVKELKKNVEELELHKARLLDCVRDKDADLRTLHAERSVHIKRIMDAERNYSLLLAELKTVREERDEFQTKWKNEARDKYALKMQLANLKINKEKWKASIRDLKGELERRDSDEKVGPGQEDDAAGGAGRGLAVAVAGDGGENEEGATTPASDTRSPKRNLKVAISPQMKGLPGGDGEGGGVSPNVGADTANPALASTVSGEFEGQSSAPGTAPHSSPLKLDEVPFTPGSLNDFTRNFEFNADGEVKFKEECEKRVTGRLFEKFFVVGMKPADHSAGGPAESYEPHILFHYPPGDLSDSYLSVPHFCFPEGVQAKKVQRRPSESQLNNLLYSPLQKISSPLSPASHVFVLTDEYGNLTYGVCVSNYELLDQESTFFDKEKQAPEKGRKLGSYHYVAPRGYCFISKHPIFGPHFNVLGGIIGMERLNRMIDSAVTTIAAKAPDSVAFPDFAAEKNLRRKCPRCKMMMRASEETCKSCGAHVRSRKKSIRVGLPRGLGKRQSQESAASTMSQDDAVLAKGSPSNRFQRRKSESSLPDSTRGGSSDEDNSDGEEEGAAATQTEPNTAPAVMAKPARGKQASLDDSNPIIKILSAYYEDREFIVGSAINLELPHIQPLEIPSPFGKSRQSLMAKWAVVGLFLTLSLENIVRLLDCILLERSIIFQSSKLGAVSCVVLSMVSLLEPLNWQTTFIPILPRILRGVLEAPTSYLVGVNQLPDKDDDVDLSEITIVNIDEDKVIIPPHYAGVRLPGADYLCGNLRSYYIDLLAATDGEVVPEAVSPFKLDARTFLVEKMLGIINQYLTSIVDYVSNNVIMKEAANEWEADEFDFEEGFLDMLLEQDRAFYEQFKQTQMFHCYHHERQVNMRQLKKKFLESPGNKVKSPSYFATEEDEEGPDTPGNRSHSSSVQDALGEPRRRSLAHSEVSQAETTLTEATEDGSDT